MIPVVPFDDTQVAGEKLPVKMRAEVVELAGDGGGSTDLSATRTATAVDITSNTGTDATILAADATYAGVMSAADKAKLNGIATGATAYTDAQANAVIAAQRNAANGYAGLDNMGKVSAAQLPSYVDDVLEYANRAAFPGVGTSGVIYMALDTGKSYRWSGSDYADMSVGGGDASTNTGTSVDGEAVVFSGTTGKTVRRSVLSGIIKQASGVQAAAVAGTDYVAPGGALGTPSSGTLTNCSGLPIAGVVASTSAALGVGSVELGHASDTTLSRPSAGNLAVEGNLVYRAGGTDVPVADGGTGASTLTANAVLLGNGTSPVQAVAPGTSGNVLTSNGTAWTSAAPTGGPGGGLDNVVEDTTPQLGGNLDPNGHKILASVVTPSTNSSSTQTIDTDVTDIFGLTALAVDTTISTSGSPTNGQILEIYIQPTATRQIAWNASNFENGTTALLPTATNGTQRLDVVVQWNAATNKWRCQESSYNAPTISSATSLTLSASTLRYVFTGGSTANWTLPLVSTCVGTQFVVYNRGTANLTLTRTSPDNVFTTSAVFNVIVPPGATAVLFNDGTYWVVQSPAQSLYEPRIGSVREAATGNKTFEFWSEASAVNYLVAQSKAAGSGPNLQVAGTDTNSPLNLFPKGDAPVRISVGAGLTPTLAGNISGGGNGNLNLVSPGSGGKVQANGFDVVSKRTAVPTLSTDTGIAGQVAWDTSYFYVCTATNTWRRTALASW